MNFGKIGCKQLFSSYLPYDAEVEYLQGDGASAIIIPWSYQDGFRGTIEVSYYRSTISGGEGIFGQSESSSLTRLGVYHQRNNDNLSRQGISGIYAAGNFSPWFSSSTQQLSKKFTLSLDLDALVAKWFNGTESQLHIGTYEDIYFYTNVTAFGFWGQANANGSAMMSYSKVKMCSIRLRNNGITVYDLIPVRVGTTGYMYDKVSRQFLDTQGPGAFIIGPDKVTGGGN